MRSTTKAIVLFTICVFAPLSGASAQETETLKSMKSGKVIFDFRSNNLKSVALHMKLIHQTFEDLAAAGKDPEFKVSFMGPAVKLISKNREGFAAEDQKDLDAIAEGISVLSKDGIGMDVCLIAAGVFKVDPASILPEIKATKNGWFSLISYQSQGYSLVAVY